MCGSSASTDPRGGLPARAVPTATGPAMNSGGAVAATDDAADGDDGNVDQQMFAIPRRPRVGQRFKV